MIHYEYASLIDGLLVSAILRDLEFTYHWPFASTVGHWRGGGGVYVYKLAFFF